MVNNYLFDQLTQLLDQTALCVSESQKVQLIQFVELLIKWNKAYNLTAIRDPEEMLVKHIMDSLVVSPYLQGSHFIDVGTGPGLPGIPLAIINPEHHYTLLDSLGKRIRFIEFAMRQLNLTNISPIRARVEQFQPEKTFDGVLSRAFASLKDMTDWCHHLIDNQGRFYALKGDLKDQEIKEINKTIFLDKNIKLEVPELVGERNLVILGKR